MIDEQLEKQRVSHLQSIASGVTFMRTALKCISLSFFSIQTRTSHIRCSGLKNALQNSLLPAVFCTAICSTNCTCHRFITWHVLCCSHHSFLSKEIVCAWGYQRKSGICLIISSHPSLISNRLSILDQHHLSHSQHGAIAVISPLADELSSHGPYLETDDLARLLLPQQIGSLTWWNSSRRNILLLMRKKALAFYE